jgi:hypothetical protein
VPVRFLPDLRRDRVAIQQVGFIAADYTRLSALSGALLRRSIEKVLESRDWSSVREPPFAATIVGRAGRGLVHSLVSWINAWDQLTAWGAEGTLCDTLPDECIDDCGLDAVMDRLFMVAKHDDEANALLRMLEEDPSYRNDGRGRSGGIGQLLEVGKTLVELEKSDPGLAVVRPGIACYWARWGRGDEVVYRDVVANLAWTVRAGLAPA